MSVGVFDDPGRFRLALKIFIDRKPDGHASAGEHARWTSRARRSATLSCSQTGLLQPLLYCVEP